MYATARRNPAVVSSQSLKDSVPMWVDKDNWVTVDNVPGAARYRGKSQHGAQGNHVNPNPYVMHAGKFSIPIELPNGAKVSVDIPNLKMNYDVESGPSSFPSLRNASWADLIETIRGTVASSGTTLGEWSESTEMIAKRATQMYRSYKALRKGDFNGFLKELGIARHRRHRGLKPRETIRQASGLWLEYSFGWKPLVTDIYRACDAMGQPLPGGVCSGSAHESYVKEDQAGRATYAYSCDIFMKQGAHVYVNNPNLYLAQQMGLANPAAVAWELVPFSFMVDWVFDVGSFLGGFSDLLGCEVLYPYTTVYGKGNASLKYDWFGTPLGPQTGKTFAVCRQIGLTTPAPNLDFLANIGTSLSRAANAVSLLGQILTK